MVALTACGREADPGVSRRPVILITVDTLRADRVGRGVAPAIDALAARSVRFLNARTPVPLTLPAHVSLMTGSTPLVHGVRENGVPFSANTPTMVRVFRDAGYRTAAFVGAYVLDRRFGVSDGFETYDDRVRRDPAADARLEAERKSEEVVDAAIRWLDSASTPFFLWVHLYDPHAPYEPPAAFRDAASPYDGEVKYADSQVGRLLARVRERGFEQDAVIAITGDHGEGLGEHGEQTHGLLAYDSTLRVPLTIAAPGLTPRQIAAPVSLIDVAPALLRLAGVSGVLGPGASRVDLFQPPSRADVYAETQYPRAAGWHPLAVLAGEQWKLVLSSEKELFDLNADPGELRNVAAERPAIAEGMAGVLARIQASAAPPANATIAPDAAERLRTLGYVSGSGSSSDVPSGAPNPARTVGDWTKFERALGRLNSGETREALPDLQQLASRYPIGLVFQTTYARAVQQITSSGDAALKILRGAVARHPPDATLFHELAVAARAAGDMNEALRAEQAALALQKDNPAALNGLGLLHADAGRAADAAAAFERAAVTDPTNASYWSNLGNARRALGETAAAEAAYRRALDADASHPDAANGIGVLLVQRGKPADAVPWFERALQSSADFHEARVNLGIAYQESGQQDRAAAVYREVIAKAPAGSRERKAATELLRGVK